MNIIEHYRKEAVNSLFSTASFNTFWDLVKNDIKEEISPATAANFLDLGDKLGPIFRSVTTERNQSGVSSAGNVWESFVCWYLNLCLAGSRTVVFKQKKTLMPSAFKSALKVKYNNFPSNTESDLIAITFPDSSIYNEQIEDLSSHSSNIFNDVNLFNRNNKFNFLKALDILSEQDFSQYEIVVIQCKTNWNDNAQIPMLWDMVYSSEGFSRNIIVGTDGYTLSDLHNFSYAFVTVPTVALEKFQPSSTPVKRVNNLSGGNYWGFESRNDVASSVKEIFSRNFPNASEQGIRSRLASTVANHLTDYPYFGLD